MIEMFDRTRLSYTGAEFLCLLHFDLYANKILGDINNIHHQF